MQLLVERVGMAEGPARHQGSPASSASSASTLGQLHEAAHSLDALGHVPFAVRKRGGAEIEARSVSRGAGPFGAMERHYGLLKRATACVPSAAGSPVSIRDHSLPAPKSQKAPAIIASPSRTTVGRRCSFGPCCRQAG